MKTKKDIEEVLKTFTLFAHFDEELQKHYIVFEDRKRNGIWTLMKKEEQWSIHGRGDRYCDDGETFLSESELVRFLWKNRAAFNSRISTLKIACL